MERLTTNKNVSEMGMWELAHNSCYIDKDGNARYRDFCDDVDARVLTRELLKKYADGDDAFIDDDDFDNQMMEALQYGTYTREGLIALFYRNLWAMADLREYLKAYEDAEEQGVMKILPVSIGSDVYFIPSKTNYKLNVLNGYEQNNRIYHQNVANIVFNKHGWYLELDKNLEHGIDHILVDKFYKETWFTTKKEAEQALKQMGV